ncbi:MAG: peptide-methionine (S)-S-oxide reductase MsrA [Legionellaceae bacterium]|nr:peptide-methionine (S)-S-oxide reductase MsrA [Legionellaceae bacterium]
MQKAIFAAGCFWGVEHIFRQVNGVISVKVGYTGGHLINPTYSLVCHGDSGHAEAVIIDFEPDIVSYETLVKIFFLNHTPTSFNKQGADVGSQYRSAIFYNDTEQQQSAEKIKSELDNSGQFDAPIVTEISPATVFYAAEEYHQRYFEKNGVQGCDLKR